MARKNRSARIADEIRRITARALQTEVRDPRIPFLTSVSDVKVSRDLSYATILFTVPGDERAKFEVMDILDKSKGFFRSAVARGLSLRTAPELIFELDRSAEAGAAIDDMLLKIRRERAEREASEPADAVIEAEDEAEEGVAADVGKSEEAAGGNDEV